MSTTTYSGNFDVDNIQRLGTLVNATDSGSNCNLSISGVHSDSFVDAGPLPSPEQITAEVTVTPGPDYLLMGDADHAGVIGPIPVGSAISKVVLRFNAAVSLTTQGSFEAATGILDAITGASQYEIGLVPFPYLPSWITDENIISTSNIDQEINTPPTNFQTIISLSTNPIIEVEYDFSQNPGGAFPQGFMSYDDFIINFTQVGIILSSNNISASQFNTLTIGTAAAGSTTVDLSGNVSVLIVTNNWSMIVTWSQAFRWTLETPGPVVIGSPIVITSPDEDLCPNLEGIQIIVGGETFDVPNQYIEICTPDRVVFTVPPEIGNSGGTAQIVAVIKPPSGGGTIFVGIITILIENASGIYRIIKDKTADTLYDRDTPGATINVRIPNPFAKTGFIGG